MVKLCWVCKPRKEAVYQDSQGDYYCQDCFDHFEKLNFQWKYGKPTKIGLS